MLPPSQHDWYHELLIDVGWAQSGAPPTQHQSVTRDPGDLSGARGGAVLAPLKSPG